MLVISIVNGDYKPTYNWGVPPCNMIYNEPTWRFFIATKARIETDLGKTQDTILDTLW